MGRSFAGIMGLTAFVVVILRGLLNGGSAESVLATACPALFVFAAAGLILGAAAERTIRESVQVSFNAQLEKMQQSEQSNTSNSTT